MNVRLRQGGVDFDKLENMMKAFRVEILDQGNVIYKKEGIN